MLNWKIINLLKNNPEYFYDDVKISAIYGTFPGAIWNGGRIINGGASIQEIEEVTKSFNETGIPIRFTFTNCLIEKEHLNDRQCNLIMDIANNGLNEVLVTSPLLEDYLRNKYPNFKYLSSTTKCIVNENEIKEESNKYYLTVLDYRKNIDFDFLKSLKNPDKYELLINAYCSPNCKRRTEHYEQISRNQLKNQFEYFFCEDAKPTFYESLKWPTVIKANDLYNIYNKELGFKHFKVEGRTSHIIDVIASYVYYLIKPEYQEVTKHNILKEMLVLS